MSWQTITKENNLAISVVPLSELNLANRLDAEHYQPHFIAIIDAVKNKKYKKLSDLVSKTITTGHTPSMKEESFYGGDVKFIKTDNLRENQIVENFNHYLSDKGANKLKNALLKEDDIIVTIIGATYEVVGRVARVFPDLGRATINQNISLIRPTIASGYLSCFLMGKYGKQQLHYLSRQTEQVNLNNVEVSDVLVPLASDTFVKKIHETHNKTHELFVSSEKLFKEAEQMLLKEINLEDYKATDENVSIRNFTDCNTGNRFDAEYWQPKYDEIEKRVSAIPQKKLSEIVSVKKGVETGSEAYSEEGNLFIRVSDFSIYGIDEGEKRISEELYTKLKENYRPHKGEVLFTKDGTIGISFALHEDVEAVVSSAFLRFKPKIKINNDYLALALNSSYCKAQIERMSGGAIIAHLKPDSAMKIKIPMLSDKKQEELAEKMSDALRLRKEAKTLLEKAKRAVEIFVEQDEKEALSFISK
jgi:type I restriction enzyme S subunit